MTPCCILFIYGGRLVGKTWLAELLRADVTFDRTELPSVREVREAAMGDSVRVVAVIVNKGQDEAALALAMFLRRTVGDTAAVFEVDLDDWRTERVYLPTEDLGLIEEPPMEYAWTVTHDPGPCRPPDGAGWTLYQAFRGRAGMEILWTRPA